MKKLLFALAAFICGSVGFAQNKLDSVLPVRGFCIAAPLPNEVDAFVTFITGELAPRKVNTLILRVDYNYRYKSHPELRDDIALSESDVKKIVAACRAGNIKVIPQVNLLGHQSWAETTHNLLRKYPEFDETPHVKMPQKYKWPNADSLYCKSYCPLHPGVHKVVFALVDEICNAFETDAFHAGMDEVFYIGDSGCPRCKGKDKAALFADEVNRINDHLAKSNKTLWIWGDRLLDGSTTGLGMWEASTNGTYPAIDRVSKNVVICDWHYERPDKTAVYFAMKGFKVITCPWRNPGVAVVQLQDMVNFRTQSVSPMNTNFYGIMQTVWSGAGGFMQGYYQNKKDQSGGENTQWHCFKALYGEIEKLR
ncbi:MAG: family 20 glycosylhydrolase [Chitinophagaceae bacterium]|nr:family 20 glycosylhydrolase [Chitinophagaceae bacterium]